ncbi:hypothetical protein SAMN05421670_0676 [Psychrobacillus psychrotolerans]|uniref:Uncharacterized protein n=1 Tax=Psychrobacillus psychrotolerans TaxID=126156 RepID=A0A1I5V570_9BACI|nr:hypothetical protein SAMN05421670_0676 [Psychrobacillus psychrotolerans]
MDIRLNKRLNKQGVVIAILHTIIILNLTIDFFFIH